MCDSLNIFVGTRSINSGWYLQRVPGPPSAAAQQRERKERATGLGGAGSGGAPQGYMPPVPAIGQHMWSTSGQPSAAGHARATHVVDELLAGDSKAESEVDAFLAKHIQGATSAELAAYAGALHVDGYRSMETIALLTPEEIASYIKPKMHARMLHDAIAGYRRV